MIPKPRKKPVHPVDDENVPEAFQAQRETIISDEGENVRDDSDRQVTED